MFRKLCLLALSIPTVFGIPIATQPTDADVLQIALTLEHLENAFYSQALAKYSESDFERAGLSSDLHGRFSQIAKHEAEHVNFLSSILGENATQPCDYVFPDIDPQSFAALSIILENIGTSAYIGAARYISNKEYLTAAGSILAVEARHASWVGSSALDLQPWNGPFDVSLGIPGPVFSLAAQFIKSCPLNNYPNLFMALPDLILSDNSPAHGSSITISLTNLHIGRAYVAWMNGLQVVYSDVGLAGLTVVPHGLAGTVFAALVSTKDGPPSDANLLSGLAVLQFPLGVDS